MRLDVSQQLRLEQQMKLAPRIIQAMEILQLPMLALQERIEEEMESNPVLELRIEGVDDQAPPAEVEEDEARGEHDMVVNGENGNSDDFERLAEFTDEYGTEFLDSEAPARPRPAPPGERDRKMDAMANTPAPGETLNEYLLHQWAFVETDEQTRAAGQIIINHIDDDGYLRTPLEEMPGKTNQPIGLERFRQALLLVQTLEPPGVGARDLRECLVLQLAAEQASGRDVALEMELVQRFLRDIEMNRLPLIAKRTGRSVDEIKRAIENLSHLNPRPGSLVAQRTVPVILPDILVDLDDDGQVHITMPDGNTPRLRISKSYRKLARDRRTERPVRQFLRKNIRSAQWLIGAIEQRRETVRRVAEEVFHVQHDFLEQGTEALRPLPMVDVANKVGVHVATVSRAVAGKYVETPRGIFPLRMFFS
ncbi:MAG: hypothetical protein AMS14_10670, partial [Planctomycetes bacterium DG_20]